MDRNIPVSQSHKNKRNIFAWFDTGNLRALLTSTRWMFFLLSDREFTDTIESINMKKTSKITDKMLLRAATQSSKMEGVSVSRAKKNKAVIKRLKQYGRAFSV